jgi:hypothetical protein
LYYGFICDCGNICSSTIDRVKAGRKKSCGCLNTGTKRNDLTGQRFNNYLVVEFSHVTSHRDSYYNCLCDCGNKELVLSHGLIGRAALSCPKCRKIKKYISGELLNVQWLGYIRGAKARDLEFSITPEYVWKLFLSQGRKCTLSGVDLVMRPENHSTSGTASLDRINSSKGYTEENIHWIHKDINQMKWAYSVEKLVYWCEKITNHKKEKNAS